MKTKQIIIVGEKIKAQKNLQTPNPKVWKNSDMATGEKS